MHVELESARAPHVCMYTSQLAINILHLVTVLVIHNNRWVLFNNIGLYWFISYIFIINKLFVTDEYVNHCV